MAPRVTWARTMSGPPVTFYITDVTFLDNRDASQYMKDLYDDIFRDHKATGPVVCLGSHRH